MITGVNESKILLKQISRKCECKFDSRKCHSNNDMMINIGSEF